MASVDVIVPCYNYARFLHACVQSVLSQSGVDVRVIVIDDQSSDDTLAVGTALASSDKRVEFHRHEVNRGHIATYNEGLAMASADYVVLLSADDLLTPGSLQRATSLMDANPSVGLTYGYPIPLHTDLLPPPRMKVESWSVWPGHKWIELMCRSGRNFVTCPEVVMRTRVQHEIGGYRPSLPHSGDMELWIRAALVSDVGRINGADQAYYRVHAASMQRTVHAGFLLDLRARRDAIASAFEHGSVRLPNSDAMLAMADRGLARIAIERARFIADTGISATGESVDDCCNFAASLDPSAINDRLRNSLDRARRARLSYVSRLALAFRTFVRHVREHLRWRRWYRTGVF